MKVFLNILTIVGLIVVLGSCEEHKSTQKPEGYSSGSVNVKDGAYTDINVQCVLAIEKVQLNFSTNETEFEKEKDKEYIYEQSIGKLTENDYPVLIWVSTSISSQGDIKTIYDVTPSYLPCNSSKEHLSKVHFETYGKKANIKITDLDNYINILKGN